MEKKRIYGIGLVIIAAWIVFIACTNSDARTPGGNHPGTVAADAGDTLVLVDTSAIPHDKFGEAVRYGLALMDNTAYYIGPDGINGQYTRNKMNCTNCHQDAGTKPFSFNLLLSHASYPQYRAREGKVLDLAERVNNCVMHPHNGRPLPLDSREMIGLLSYLKWINSYATGKKTFKGARNLELSFPSVAADPQRGRDIYIGNCARCHGSDGAGKMRDDNVTYTYPPLWGLNAYQPGSSMHRIIKAAQWIKANMPYDKSAYGKPFLTDAEALDVAAFINDDQLHTRPYVKSYDYPNPLEKALDYDRGPFVDSFSALQHKYGPYGPIIQSYKDKGMTPAY
ncbi:MAG TPA: c-type cytochrome [Puia sp.]|jgi:thiosulfate dehydrogenase|nr:c-type cytochrome [Puia sp.]